MTRPPCASSRVTKGFGPEAVVAARAAGLDDIGENYANELVAKAAEVAGDPSSPSPLRWHFLGAIQRNKVARLAPIVGLWQSVSRVEEGARIARFAPGATVLVEVDTTGLSGRNGCPPDGVRALVPRLRDAGLDVRGLMTVAAPGLEAARSFADGALAGRRTRSRGALDGDDRRPRSRGPCRHHDGADRPGVVR